MGCCTKRTKGKTNSDLIHNLKSSIFCGAKGFLTFNLASLSYLEFTILLTRVDGKKDHILNIRKDAAFIIKKSIIPFLEMIIIPLLVHFVCPSLTSMYCMLMCAAFMISTCFIVRHFNLNKRLLSKMVTTKKIEDEFDRDSLAYPPICKKGKNERIRYNSPYADTHRTVLGEVSYIVMFLIFPVKCVQSCIFLALAVIELIEAIPSFLVDLFYNRSFESTKSNLQKSGHLLYASMRNSLPISQFDEPVTEWIGMPTEKLL